MIRRFLLPMAFGFAVAAVWVEPAWSPPMLSGQGTVLRAQPATVLRISGVAAAVRLNCGSGQQSITPSPFRETGTGWFIDPSGWVITNGHVVQPAYETPRWLVNQMAQRAVTTACLESALKANRMQ